MGKLYDINRELEDLIIASSDEETGELIASDEIIKRMDELQMEKEEVLAWVAKMVLNCDADIEAIKAEEKRLGDRKKKLAQKSERLLEVLDRECAGQKKNFGFAIFSYRKTPVVDVTDEKQVEMWSYDNEVDGIIRYKDPEVNKIELKKMLKEGYIIPGCQLVEKQSYGLR